MKKIFCILTAVLTFFLGATVYFVYLNFEVNKSKRLVKPFETSSLPLTSLCDAKNDYNFFDPPKFLPEIRVKANFMVRENDDLRIFEMKRECDNRFVQVRFEESADKEIEDLISQLREQSSEDLTAIAEVEAVGELEFSGRVKTR
jgi:hypothetical protein